jgi:hypothetical protein
MTQKKTTQEVPLEYPVEHDGKTYDKLMLRRMRAGDTLVAEETESKAKAGFLMYAAMAGVPVEVIEGLDIDDLMALIEKAVPLMGKSGAGMLKEMTDALEQA